MRVGLTYNLKKKAGSEDVGGALRAIEAVRDALLERHETVEMIEADPDAFEKLRSARPQMVFNMAGGLCGESRGSQMPAIMEMLRIPYTGSAPLPVALCQNKARAKETLSHYGIPAARFLVAQSADAGIEHYLSFPMTVKPMRECSGKGQRGGSIVKDPEELKEKVASVIEEHGQPALVEECLPGREFSVALLGNGGALRALPIVEVDRTALLQGAGPAYSYGAQAAAAGAQARPDIFSCPADVNGRLASAIGDVAKDAFRALGVRDWCRIDVRLDSSGVPHVVEIDPLPGISPVIPPGIPEGPEAGSRFSRAANAAGMDLSALVNGVLDIARNRLGL